MLRVNNADNTFNSIVGRNTLRKIAYCFKPSTRIRPKSAISLQPLAPPIMAQIVNSRISLS